MKKTFKYPKLTLFLFITVISLFIFVPYLISGTAYILDWDMRTLYISNFENLRTVLQDFVYRHEAPFWSWASFLGNDYYSSKLFYFQDVFDYPFALTSLPYTTVIMIQTYLKFLVAGFSFYAYSNYHKYTSRTSIYGSLMFAFSSYMLWVVTQPFFASFIVFIPLYFLAVDRYIQENKKSFFIFMVFFMFINNYYLFYAVSLFTIVYYIYQWKMYYKTTTNMMKKAFELIGYYMVGFAMSGIVVLPEVLFILENNRVGARSAVLYYHSIIPYLDYLVSLFMPMSALSCRGTDIVQLYSYSTANHSVMMCYLWATSVLALLVPQLFHKEHYKKDYGIITVLVTSIALIPILSSVMHGFSEPSFRWLASVSFFLITLCLPFLEDLNTLNKRCLKITTIILVLAIPLTTPLIALCTNVEMSTLMNDERLLMYYVVFVVVAFIAMHKNNHKLLMASMILELCAVSYFSFYGNPGYRKWNLKDQIRTTTIMGKKNDYNKFLLEADPSNKDQFYRSYIDPQSIYWGLSTSFNLDYNIMGLMSYDSTYIASNNDLALLKYDSVIDYLPWTFNIKDPYIMNLVSTKYAVVQKEEEVPFNHYEFAFNYAGMQIYKNLDYINLGQTYKDIMTYDDYDESMVDQITNYVICHKEDYDEIKQHLGSTVQPVRLVTYSNNYLYTDITVDEPSFVVLSIPYDKGWRVTVNHQDVKTYKVNGGLYGIPLEKGKNIIEMSFTPNGFKKGKYISFVGCLLFVVITVIGYVKSKND